VNYDPVDKTVLANEQVDANGNSWRSGAKVEKKMLKQWFLKISEFRQALLDDLKQLEKNGAWPERVLAMQKNWLGKSTGARIKFPVVAYDQQTHSDIEVFTTRPDTLFGVQYLALASIHPIVQNLAKTDVELQAFLDTIPALPTDSKVGYLLPHVRAQNPLAAENSTPDATKASLPLYVAPYVLGDYGDGAVMGVPGHDVRDHAFWKHNRYDDPVRVVVSQSPDGSTTALRNKPFVHVGYLTHHSGPYARMTTEQATKEIIALLESKGLGSAAETWRLRDWLVSRQRYWGTPIPIIHCDGCGPVPVPKDQLPVELPSVDEHWMEGKTGNPLDHAHDWVNTTCPKCGGAAKRETDTMDTFVDSSWYFMRFLDSHNDKLPLSPEAANSNLPVDVYIGGVEHAILHLLYARFISKFLATTPLWPEGSKSHGEPFKRILTQGMVHGKTYSDPANGRFLKPAEVDISNPSKPIVLATGSVANVSFEKMSKSKYNGVDPSTCMEKYGADATRAHILFQAPVSEVLEWDEEKISGVIRWLRRLYDFIHVNHQTWIFMDPFFTFNPKNHLIQLEDYMQNAGNAPPGINRLDLRKAVAKISASDKALWRSVQGTIANVTASYGNTYSLNTVVSDLMTLTNVILEHAQLLERINYTPPSSKNRPMEATAKPSPQLMRLAIMELLKMMAPITPAFAEECWAKTGGKKMETVPMLSKLASYFGRSVFRGSRERSISIFDEPFPTEDGTFDMLASDTQTCAVQINGKFRFAVKIPFPPTGLKGKALESWIKQEILETKEGATRLTGRMEKGKKHVDIRNATKVIVVGGGRTVNFVVLL
jgi:leucyl-tRNA synthetase